MESDVYISVKYVRDLFIAAYFQFDTTVRFSVWGLRVEWGWG